MAAFRDVKVRKWTLFGSIKNARARIKREIKKWGSITHPRIKLDNIPGMEKTDYHLWQVVATKAVETATFKPVGNVFVWFPDPADSDVLEKIRNPRLHQIDWIFFAKKIGIFATIFHYKMDSLLDNIPGSQMIAGKKRIVRGPDGRPTPLLTYPEAIFAVPELETFVIEVWWKNTMLDMSRRKIAPPHLSGLWLRKGHAAVIAAIYGIIIDTDTLSSAWIRTPDIPAITPEQQQDLVYEANLDKARKLVDLFFHRLSDEERKYFEKADICEELIRPNFPHQWERICKDLGLID